MSKLKPKSLCITSLPELLCRTYEVLFQSTIQQHTLHSVLLYHSSAGECRKLREGPERYRIISFVVYDRLVFFSTDGEYIKKDDFCIGKL